MFKQIPMIIVALLYIGSISVSAQLSMVRINQSGDVIDGPISTGGSGCNGVCKVSDAGYIYYISGNGAYVYAYDSSLSYVNNVWAITDSLSIDNTRQEIDTGNTIRRFGPTLVLLDEEDVYGNVSHVTVDQNDGAIWYTDNADDEKGLYKVDHEFDPIYNFPGNNYILLSDVSPSGYFWVYDLVQKFIELRSSDGSVLAQGNIEMGYELRMYFADMSCWMISASPSGVTKVNSSGTIVYNNSADFNYPKDLDVDQSDGSVWIADTSNFEVVHLDACGNELLRKSNDWTPFVVAVDPSDSTVIVLYQPGEIGIESASLGEIKAHYAEPEE